MTRKYTRVVLIYEVLLVVDSSIYGTFFQKYEDIANWGEPERAPHKREVCVACLSVCFSVCPYVHDKKIYKSSINLRGTFSC